MLNTGEKYHPLVCIQESAQCQNVLWEERSFNAKISSYYTHILTSAYVTMTNWLIKERQYLNYGIRTLQPGEAIFFIYAALIFLNYIRYYRFIYKTDTIIIEMTILYKKDFTDIFNFYPSPNHCHIGSYLPFWSSFWKILSNCFKDTHPLILQAPGSNQKVQLLEKQGLFFCLFVGVFFELWRSFSTNRKFSEMSQKCKCHFPHTVFSFWVGKKVTRQGRVN